MKLTKFIEDVKYNLNDTFTEEVYRKYNTSRKANEFSENLKWSTAEMDEEGNKKGSLPSLADRQGPAPTSETKPGSSASESIITEHDKYVKRKEKARQQREALDREYLKAIEDGNVEKQLQMIIDKYKKTKGIC